MPAAFHQPRGWLWRSIGRLYLRLGGWRIEGTFPADPKYIVVVAPHTSNWDFPLGVAVLFAHELRISWLAKHSMFLLPVQDIFPVAGRHPHQSQRQSWGGGRMRAGFQGEPPP